MAKQRHRRYESCDVLLVLGVPEITKRPNDWRSSTTGGSLSEGRSQIVRHRLGRKAVSCGNGDVQSKCSPRFRVLQRTFRDLRPMDFKTARRCSTAAESFPQQAGMTDLTAENPVQLWLMKGVRRLVELLTRTPFCSGGGCLPGRRPLGNHPFA